MLRQHFTKSLLFFNFIFIFHYTINSYINSSFLEQYLSVTLIGFLFTIAALIAILALSQAEKILVRFGGLLPTLILLAIDSFALFGLAILGFKNIFTSPLLPAVFFIVHYAVAIFILRFALDIFYEAQSKDSETGSIRGMLLTVANLAWVISPFISAQLIGATGSFWKVYALSFLLSLVSIILSLVILPRVKKPLFKKIYFFETLKEVRKKKNIYRIFFINFLLQFFFAWTIIYLPIYLHKIIGFSWKSVGILLTIMLIPYILIDIPIGKLADKYFGEKELLFIGFTIIIIFTFPISFMSGASFLFWAIILFISRIGASIIEIMSETYFFKKVKAEDGNLISFFRNSQPFAYVIAPLVGSVLIFLGITLEYLFVILSVIMIAGIFVTFKIKDTL